MGSTPQTGIVDNKTRHMRKNTKTEGIDLTPREPYRCILITKGQTSQSTSTQKVCLFGPFLLQIGTRRDKTCRRGFRQKRDSNQSPQL